MVLVTISPFQYPELHVVILDKVFMVHVHLQGGRKSAVRYCSLIRGLANPVKLLVGSCRIGIKQ